MTVKHVFVIESFIQEIRSKTLIHSVMCVRVCVCDRVCVCESVCVCV